jgi:hypothetical protein
MATDLQFNVTALDKATATFVKLAEQVDRLAKKIDKLDGKHATATVDVDTDKADREIGAFAAKMRKRIEAAVKALPDIELKADASDADKALARVRGELKDLSGKTIGVDISAEDAKAEMDRLREELNRLGRDSASIQVKADVAEAIAQLDAVDGKVKRLDGKTAKVKVDVDKSLSDSLIQVTRLGSALRALALPAAAVAAAPQLAAMGAAAVSLTGAIGPVPALLGAAGLAAGVASVSFGTLTKYFTADSDKKKTQAFNALSASGQNLATTIKDLTPRFDELRHATQNAVFEGLAREVKPLADAYLPMLQREMVKTGSIFNAASITLAQFFQKKTVADDLSGSLTSMRVAIGNVVQAAAPLAHVFVDVLATGAARLPSLTAGIGAAAQRMADFVDKARASGDLGQWMDLGIAKVQQLGRIAMDVGGSLFSIFKAASASGADFLSTVEKVTNGINNFLRSAQGQTTLVAVFTEIRATVDALTPGVQALASAVANVIARLASAGVIHEAAAALSAMAISVAPLIEGLGSMASTVLPPILQLLGGIAPVLGPIVAGFLAWKVASAGIGQVQGALESAGKSLANAALNAGTMTEKFTGSAAAGEKVATAGGKIQGALGAAGSALPVIGLAVAGITTAYEIWGSKADEAAQKVLNGSLSLQAAIAQEAQQIHSNQIEWLGGMNAQESYAAAAKNVKAEIDEQRASMSPMQQLTSDVARAQADLNDAVAQYGPASQQAQAAAAALASARDREKAATDGVKQATQSYGDAVVEAANKAAGAANADLGYQQSLLSLKDASNQAADAARNHAAGSDEVTRANLAVQQASLSAAAAAQTKAQKDAEARGASDAAAIGAQAYKDELQRQADTLTGPAKAAAEENIRLLGGQRDASATAQAAANFYKGELQSLADKQNGPLRDAILGTIRDLDNAGGAHATAQQKADAQRAMLQRLADQAQGPTRDAILAMIRTIDQIHDKSFTVTGTGVVNGVRSTTGSTAPGAGARARGGIVDWFADGGVTPGYTPGRDVHTFRSATGGTLHLSGGEAVMRPEWTRAVGPGYVNSANAAARNGGVAGVQRYNATGRYADGGIIGGRFAGGGVVLNGVQPFSVIPQRLDDNVTGSLVSRMVPTIVSMVKAAEAAIAAAAARLALGASVALGGGGARNWIIAHESGGNPRAQNPTSSASGLYQMIDGTWRAYGGSTAHAKDASVAEQNAVADRYVAARYGSWENAQRFWMAHHYYDRGGYLMPGTTMATNATGTPERVLSPTETRAYDQAPTGRHDSALIAELRTQNQQLRALRGDVDQGGYFGALIAEVHALNVRLSQAGSSVVAEAQGARFASVFGTI